MSDSKLSLYEWVESCHDAGVIAEIDAEAAHHGDPVLAAIIAHEENETDAPLEAFIRWAQVDWDRIGPAWNELQQRARAQAAEDRRLIMRFNLTERSLPMFRPFGSRGPAITKHPPQPCAACGKEFKPLMDYNRFCSRACRGLFHRTERVCKACGEKFTRPREGGRKDFCSDACSPGRGGSASKLQLVHEGQSKTLNEWADVTGIPYPTIYRRMKKGLPTEQILGKE